MVLDGQLTDRDLLAQTRGSERFDGTPRPVWALLSDGYKVIFDERAGTVELYHLESDPAERHDLADREPLRARALLQRLLAQRQRYRSEMALRDQNEEPAEPLDEEALQRLRSLGYVR